EPDGPVVGLVEVAADEGLLVGQGDDQVGTVAADGGGDVPAQRHAVLDRPVGVVAELDALDTDDGGAGALLVRPGGRGVDRVHGVDPRLAAGQQVVVDPLAGGRPLRDGGSHAVLDVVGVGDDAQHGVEGGLVQGFGAALGAHGTEASRADRGSQP